jgi:hypothetical protein
MSTQPAPTTPATAMQVVVPQGVSEGVPFQCNTPSGTMTVVCPPGVKAGDSLQVNIPAVPATGDKGIPVQSQTIKKAPTSGKVEHQDTAGTFEKTSQPCHKMHICTVGPCLCMGQTCWGLPLGLIFSGWIYCKTGEGKYWQINWVPGTIMFEDKDTLYSGLCHQCYGDEYTFDTKFTRVQKGGGVAAAEMER